MQASSGKYLLKLVNLHKAEIITTVINKFETVAREKGNKSGSGRGVGGEGNKNSSSCIKLLRLSPGILV
jgi:hypothetical protein